MIKHATASTFLFHQFPDQWRLGLIVHPRLGRHMVAGGHVERDETPASAAEREALEESGRTVRLLPGPALGLPDGYPHPRVPAPWWTTEVDVPADNHWGEPHVHVDHQYVGIVESPDPVGEPAHPFAWVAEHELDGLLMFEDTRMLARALLPRIATIAAAADDGAQLFRVLAGAGLA
jgi:8-oxo-dGTP pyrophosphatase MutT (NUDIX family)